MENVKHNGVKLGLYDTQWMNCVNDPQVLAWDTSKEDAVNRAVELAEKYCIENAKKAIAAAEAAQTDHIVDSDKMVHAVPDVLEQLQLAETEVINAKTWSAGEQAKTHCKHALTAIAVARSLLYAAQKQEGV